MRRNCGCRGFGAITPYKVFFEMNGAPFEQGTYDKDEAQSRVSNLRSAGYRAWLAPAGAGFGRSHR